MSLKVLPRASRSAILPPDAEGLLPIRLCAPPVDGAANKALMVLMSEVLGVPQGKLCLKQGEKGRRKLLRVLGDPQHLFNRLEAHLGLQQASIGPRA